MELTINIKKILKKTTAIVIGLIVFVISGMDFVDVFAVESKAEIWEIISFDNISGITVSYGTPRESIDLPQSVEITYVVVDQLDESIPEVNETQTPNLDSQACEKGMDISEEKNTETEKGESNHESIEGEPQNGTVEINEVPLVGTGDGRDNVRKGTIPVSWRCDTYDPQVPADYVFLAEVPSSYGECNITLSGSVQVPQITVHVANPGETLLSHSCDGLIFEVRASENVLPKGVDLKIIKIDDTAVNEAIENGIASHVEEDIIDTRSYDITLLDQNGNEFEPVVPEDGFSYLTVSIKNMEITGEVDVFHLDDNYQVSEELEVEVDDDIQFSVTSFSIYTIVVKGTMRFQYQTDEDGTGYFLISTLDELKNFKSVVNSALPEDPVTIENNGVAEQKTIGELQKNARLLNNISLINEKWEGIGKKGNPYQGIFDGRGHTITDIKELSGNVYKGFFGFVTDGTIKDLRIEMTRNETQKVFDTNAAGIVCGKAERENFIRCSAKGNIEGIYRGNTRLNNVGGICGEAAECNVEQCYAVGNFHAYGESSFTQSDIAGAGGIIGYGWHSNVKNSYALAKVSADTHNPRLGGIVGSADSCQIENAYFLGEGTNSLYTKDRASDNNIILNSYTYEYTQNASYMNPLRNRDTYVNWDFDFVWGMNDGINAGYPYLRNVTPQTIDSVYLSPVITKYSIPNKSTVIKNQVELSLFFDRDVECSPGKIYWMNKANNMDTVPCVCEVEGSKINLSARNMTYGETYWLVIENGAVWQAENSLNVYPGMEKEYEISISSVSLRGTGTITDPYQIDSPAGLQAVQYELDKHYILTDSIDVSGYDSGTISCIGGKDNPFTGTFDGKGHRIYGLRAIKSTYSGYEKRIGVFGEIKGATIKNLAIDLADEAMLTFTQTEGGVYSTINYRYIGILVGKGDGTISNCQVRGGILSNQHTDYAGLLAGDFSGTIEKCCGVGSKVDASTSDLTYASNHVGGLVGAFSGTMKNSYAIVDTVKASASAGADATAYAGELVGVNNGSIENCYTVVREVIADKTGTMFADGNGMIKNSYYEDNSTSYTKRNGEAKTTEEMKTQDTYQGWNFENIWKLQYESNNGYPYFDLEIEYYPSDPLNRLTIKDSNGNQLYEGDAQYTELEHLALAKIVYNKGITNKQYEGKTINDFLDSRHEADDTWAGKQRYSDPIWRSSKVATTETDYKAITVGRFYRSFVGDWKIVKSFEQDNSSGFKAVAFESPDECRVIISFCGSEGVTFEALNLVGDWDTDIDFAINNKLSEQFDEADLFVERVYQLYENSEHIPNYSFTGHSLGGALAAYECVRRDKKTYSFDGAVGHMLDLAFLKNAPVIKEFDGIDKLKLVNYTDEIDFDISDLIQATNTEEFYNEYLLRSHILDNKAQNAYNCVFYQTGVDDVAEDNGKLGERRLSFDISVNTHLSIFTIRVPIKLVESEKEKVSGYSHKIFTCLTPLDENTIAFNRSHIAKVTSKPWSCDIYESDVTIRNLLASAITPGHGQWLNTTVRNFIWNRSRVILGTSNSEEIVAPNVPIIDNILEANTIIFAGNGDVDCIYGYSGDDILIAGKGKYKCLDGEGGNNQIYIDENKGSVTDVYARDGKSTTIFLRDVQKDDVVIKSCKELYIPRANQKIHLYYDETNKSKIKIYAQDSCEPIDEANRIILPSLQTMGPSSFPSLQISNLTGSNKNYVEVLGNAEIDIMDSRGTVVATISNQNGSHEPAYTDYGTLYAYDEEDIKYVAAYVYAGYTASVKGNGLVDMGSAILDGSDTPEVVVIENVDLSNGDVYSVVNRNDISLIQSQSAGEIVLPTRKPSSSEQNNSSSGTNGNNNSQTAGKIVDEVNGITSNFGAPQSQKNDLNAAITYSESQITAVVDPNNSDASKKESSKTDGSHAEDLNAIDMNEADEDLSDMGETNVVVESSQNDAVDSETAELEKDQVALEGDLITTNVTKKERVIGAVIALGALAAIVLIVIYRKKGKKS